MAEKEVYFGSLGPYLYDDADTYEDGENFRGVRVAQILVDDEATGDGEVVRYQDVSQASSETDSQVESNVLIMSEVESKVDSNVLILSEANSVVDSNTQLVSEAESGVTSNSLLLSGTESRADSGDTRVSTLESKVDSAHP